MTFTYTIASLGNGSSETVSAETNVEALRIVARKLIDDCDDSRDVAAIERTIEEGMIYTDEGQHPIFLDHDPEAFWARIAAVMTTDDVDYFPGDRAPWEDEG